MRFAVAFTDSRGCAPLTAAAAAEPSAGGAWLSWAELSWSQSVSQERQCEAGIRPSWIALWPNCRLLLWDKKKNQIHALPPFPRSKNWSFVAWMFFLNIFPGKSFSSLNNIPPSHMLPYISSWLTLSRNWLEPSLKGSGAGEHRFPRFFSPPHRCSFYCCF